MSLASIARRGMTEMPSGIYVCALSDEGNGPFLAGCYPARDRREAGEIRKSVSVCYGLVTTITIP